MTSRQHPMKQAFRTMLLVLAVSALPGAGATEATRSITTEGDCVYVDWNVSPATVIPATGCNYASAAAGGDPCVYVDWTESPPAVGASSNCT